MILVAGQAIYDFFEQSSNRAAVQFTACPGGAPFNVAVALARLGTPVSFIGALSTDHMGRKLAAALQREGIDGRWVKQSALPTALAIVGEQDGGGPSFSFYGDRPAHCDLTKADLPIVPDAVKAIYAGCFPLVQEPVGSTLLALLEHNHSTRVIAYDPNVRPSIEPDLDLWRTRFAAFAAYADIIKISSDDFAILFPGENSDAMAQGWLERGASLVLYTNGEKGSLLFGHAGQIRASAPPVLVQDTVGAGDTAMAAMLGWLYARDLLVKNKLRNLNKADMQKMLQFVSIAAAITCTRIGADPPTRAQIESF